MCRVESSSQPQTSQTSSLISAPSLQLPHSSSLTPVPSCGVIALLPFGQQRRCLLFFSRTLFVSRWGRDPVSILMVATRFLGPGLQRSRPLFSSSQVRCPFSMHPFPMYPFPVHPSPMHPFPMRPFPMHISPLLSFPSLFFSFVRFCPPLLSSPSSSPIFCCASPGRGSSFSSLHRSC